MGSPQSQKLSKQVQFVVRAWWLDIVSQCYWVITEWNIEFVNVTATL